MCFRQIHHLDADIPQPPRGLPCCPSAICQRATASSNNGRMSAVVSGACALGWRSFRP